MDPLWIFLVTQLQFEKIVLEKMVPFSQNKIQSVNFNYLYPTF